MHEEPTKGIGARSFQEKEKRLFVFALYSGFSL